LGLENTFDKFFFVGAEIILPRNVDVFKHIMLKLYMLINSHCWLKCII
jgi:hypothetical protein